LLAASSFDGMRIGDGIRGRACRWENTLSRILAPRARLPTASAAPRDEGASAAD